MPVAGWSASVEARRSHPPGCEAKASSFRANLEHSLKEAVYDLFSWVRDNGNQDVDDLVQEIDPLFIHSTAEANVQS